MPSVKAPEAPEVKPYTPSSIETDIGEFLSKRVEQMKEFRGKNLKHNSRSIENIWDEADREYQPHELTVEQGKTLVTSDDDDLRSRFVALGKEGDWQSNMASPDFYVKVNTALSILIDENPEAVFVPSAKRYEANTKVAYGNWKNSWEVSGAKQQLKKFVFNMAKYGTGMWRTYPKIVRMDKKVRTEYYPDDPTKDRYDQRSIIKFNDLCRESLNPHSVWLSEMALPGDPLSIDDWYFEREYSLDKFRQEFKDFKPALAVSGGANEGVDDPKTDESVVVGFYESQIHDLYSIWIPSTKSVLYSSPLPNDD